MNNQQARYLAMLQMARDKLKFEANSPGGLVASIDAVIVDASTVEQDALGGKPSQEALPASTTRLVYNKFTKRIDRVRNFDGLVMDSFEPPLEGL